MRPESSLYLDFHQELIEAIVCSIVITELETRLTLRRLSAASFSIAVGFKPPTALSFNANEFLLHPHWGSILLISCALPAVKRVQWFPYDRISERVEISSHALPYQLSSIFLGRASLVQNEREDPYPPLMNSFTSLINSSFQSLRSYFFILYCWTIFVFTSSLYSTSCPICQL